MKKNSNSLRRKILQKNKAYRRNSQGVPRKRSMLAGQLRMMKSFNKFVKERALLGQLTSHTEAGLPDEITNISDLNNSNNPISDEEEE